MMEKQEEIIFDNPELPEAQREGFSAYFQNLGLWKNPYAVGDPRREEWVNGWTIASDSFGRD